MDNIALDCSLRSCPTGPRWSGKPFDVSTAHTGAVECSNAGTCDRERGECDCFPGFTGDACQRVRCAKDCSDHGRCLKVSELALTYGSDSDQDGIGTAYTNWETNVNFACLCDRGFHGPNCEYGVCPFGDDPDTIPGFDAVLGAVTITGDAVTAIAVTTGGEGYNNPVITISGDGSGAVATAVADSDGAIVSVTISSGGSGYTAATATIVDEYQREYEFSITTGAASGSLGGTYALRFMGESVSFDADASALDDASMKAALESHGSFKTVTVSRGSVDANLGATYTVTVNEWESGNFNNLFSHDGNPDVSLFSCITSSVTGATTPSCTIAIVTNTNIKEFRQCAGRGACVPETGVCNCFVGYGDSNCATKTNEIVLYDSRPTFLIENTGLAFVGSVLKLTSAKAAATDFKFIEALANDVAIFDVRGDGQVYVHSGGIVVEVGGIHVMDGGLLVDEGGADISSSVLTAPALTATAFGTPYTGSVILGTAQETAATTFNLLDLQASGSTSVFTVLGNGETVVKATTAATSSTIGSLKTAGGMAVAKQLYVGGIVVTEDTTEATDSTTASVMNAGGLAVAKSIFAGIDIVAEGTTTSSSVGTGSLRTLGGLSVALDSYLGGTITATDLTDATSSTAAAVMIQGGLAVAQKSFFGDLLTVENNGIYVDAGGILVNAGGVEVTAGGLTVVAGGADITGGANVKDGLVVETGGGVIKQDGASSTAISALAESTSFADTVLDVKAARASNAAFNLITAGVGETHVPGKTITSSGTYSGIADATFTVEVTAANTYQWYKDADPATTGVALHDSPALLAEGVYITFSATSGFVTGATWTIAVVAATDVVNSAVPSASSTVFLQLDGTGDLTLSTGDVLLTRSGVQVIDHADASELQISSGGGVVVDAVTINNQAVSAVTTLDMSDDLTNSGGDIILSDTAVQQITHAHTSELQISSGGGVVVDDVTISDQAVSAVTTLDMSGHLTNSGGNIVLSSTGVQQITHVEASELQISSGGGVVVDAVTINDQAVSAVTTLDMSGDLTNSGGDIILSDTAVQQITHADTNIILSDTAVQQITHAHTSELQISSGGGVVVDAVTINDQAVSAVTTLDMSGDLTNSGGDIILSDTAVQQ
ncbi:Tenascin, partial [Hondaea fermentalgiana]